MTVFHFSIICSDFISCAICLFLDIFNCLVVILCFLTELIFKQSLYTDAVAQRALDLLGPWLCNQLAHSLIPPCI